MIEEMKDLGDYWLMIGWWKTDKLVSACRMWSWWCSRKKRRLNLCWRLRKWWRNA